MRNRNKDVVPKGYVRTCANTKCLGHEIWTLPPWDNVFYADTKRPCYYCGGKTAVVEMPLTYKVPAASGDRIHYAQF